MKQALQIRRQLKTSEELRRPPPLPCDVITDHLSDLATPSMTTPGYGIILREGAADAFGSDVLGQRTLDLLSSSLSAQTLKSYAGRLSQFAEFCHDSENISPLEATTCTVVRYVAWIGERGHIAAKSLQPYLSAINTFFELHNLDPIAKDSLHLTSARRGLMLRQRRLDAAPLRVPLPAEVAYRFVTKAELIVSAPYPEYHHDFRALLASVVNFMFFAMGLTCVSCRDSAAVAFPVPPS
eukprot:jgi/Tetstr1/440872/TSEL_029145.t1